MRDMLSRLFSGPPPHPWPTVGREEGGGGGRRRAGITGLKKVIIIIRRFKSTAALPIRVDEHYMAESRELTVTIYVNFYLYILC